MQSSTLPDRLIISTIIVKYIYIAQDREEAANALTVASLLIFWSGEEV